MQRADSFEKTLMLGKIEGRRRRGQQRMRWLDGITDRWIWVWVGSESWWWTGKRVMLQSMGSQRVWQDWVTEMNWPELKWELTDLNSLLFKRFSRVFSNNTIQSISSSVLSLLYGPIIISVHDSRNKHSLGYPELWGQSDVSAIFVWLRSKRSYERNNNPDKYYRVDVLKLEITDSFLK